MFTRYVAHVFSEWLWNSPSRPYYYRYHLCFSFHMRCISIVRSLYFRIIIIIIIITTTTTTTGSMRVLSHSSRLYHIVYAFFFFVL